MYIAAHPTLSAPPRRRRVAAHIRIVSGACLLGFAAFLCAMGHWWGLVLLAPAILHLCLAARLLHVRPNFNDARR